MLSNVCVDLAVCVCVITARKKTKRMFLKAPFLDEWIHQSPVLNVFLNEPGGGVVIWKTGFKILESGKVSADLVISL